MNDRPYQTEAIHSAIAQLQEVSSTLIVMPTGTGKTHVAVRLARMAKQGRILAIAHREELVGQMSRALRAQGIDVGIEMADQKASSSWLTPPQAVVATIQTLTSNDGARLKDLIRWPKDWSLLIVDEAHHATCNSWRMIQDHLKQNSKHKTVGITATPDRADRLALGSVFETVAFEYKINDAIEDGWLTPVRQRAVHVTGLSYENVRTTCGELNGADLAKVLQEEQILHRFASPIMELSQGRQTLAFCASVEQAERLAQILNRHQPDSAGFVCGKTPKDLRRKILTDFAEGKTQFLTNCGIATEGWDCPSVEVVAMCRPTKSRALFTQCIGRGLRPLPGTVDQVDSPAERRAAIESSSKPICEVLDFVGNAGRHQLVTTVDILGGKWPPEVQELAAEKAKQTDEPVDVEDLCEESYLELMREKEEAKRREAAQRARVVAEAKFRCSEIDLFDAVGVSIPAPRPGDGPATVKQIDLLSKFGVDATGWTKKQANKIQREVFRRIKAGLCTFRQAEALRKLGHDPSNVSKDEASKILSKAYGA